MYCPQCGQQQVTDTIRFCSRCGFLLEGVGMVLASGGQLPMRLAAGAKQPASPRSKGVKQGAMLMLSTILVVPIVAILSVNFFANPQVLIPLSALLCFVGGLLRILYALIMEDSTPQFDEDQPPTYNSHPAQLNQPVHRVNLPPASSNATPAWRSRPDTSELYQPPSVTENTTRLLDKDESSNQ